MELTELIERFNTAPVVLWHQARLEFDGERQAIVSLKVRPEQANGGGMAHACVCTFASDTSAWHTATAAAPSRVLTVNFSLSLLRTVQIGDTLRATGILTKKGRSIVVVRSQVENQDGKLVAEGLFTHSVLSNRS